MHTQKNAKLRLGLIIFLWRLLTGEIYVNGNPNDTNSSQNNQAGGINQSLSNLNIKPASGSPVSNNSRYGTNTKITKITTPSSWSNVASIPEFQPRSWDTGSSSTNAVPTTQYTGMSTNNGASMVWDPALVTWVPNVNNPVTVPMSWNTPQKTWDQATKTWITGPSSPANTVASTANAVHETSSGAATTTWATEPSNTVANTPHGGSCPLLLKKESIVLRLPVTFTTGPDGKHTIVYPQNENDIFIDHGQWITLLCSTSKFSTPGLKEKSEVKVVCNNGVLQYNEKRYSYEQFQCVKAPKAFLIKTQFQCQNSYSIVWMGFRTSSSFLPVYKTCFDMVRKHVLYAWYEARSPYFAKIQPHKNNPGFAKVEYLYKNFFVDHLYNVDQQKKTFSYILNTDESYLDKYIDNDTNHFLARGHYVPRGDFYHGFEQRTTYFYNNVGPQWQVFNNGLWHRVEDEVRSKLAASTGRQIVLTGTLGSCTLPDPNGNQIPLFLSPPDKVPVARFFWKILWDVSRNNGIAYIGLNNPYEDLKNVTYMCNNTCGGRFTANSSKRTDGTNDGLVYCCDASEFRNNYGKFSDHGPLDSSLFM